MISFRDVIRRETTEDKLGYLASRIATGDAEGLFVEAGELEQAVLDALRPVGDGWGGLEVSLRALNLTAAAAYLSARSGSPVAAHLRRASAALDGLVRRTLPHELEVRAPEGYIHYALDPIGYALAARRYARDVGRDRAAGAMVLGIRSVGTGLSAMVAAELGAFRSATLRPRGEPGRRAVSISPELRDQLLHWLAGAGDVLVVDEGPGATGETFYCIAGWLRELGVPEERIILFPSGLQPPGLASAEVRAFFERSRRYPPPDEDRRIERVCGRFGLSETEDLSAGRWRDVVPGGRGAVAVPRHERRKYRARDRDGRMYLIRYEGLGRTGVEAALRAGSLASAGLAPPVRGREDGFVVTRWVSGHVLSGASRSSATFFAALAAYLSARTALFRTGATVDVEPIMAMLGENVPEVFGRGPDGLAQALRRLERLPPREGTIPDARLQQREWMSTPEGYHKLDLTDHGDGVRLPGPTDAAWDLAGAAVEFGFQAPALHDLIERCARGGADDVAELAAAVAAYRPAYAACQLGEMALAAREMAGTEEQRRLEREAGRYRRLLRVELGYSAGASARAG